MACGHTFSHGVIQKFRTRYHGGKNYIECPMKCEVDDQGQDIRTYINGGSRVLRKNFDICERIEKPQYQRALQNFYGKHGQAQTGFDKNTQMIIFAKKINDGKKIRLIVNKTGIVGDLIKEFNNQTGVKSEHIALFFQGKNITKGSNIDSSVLRQKLCEVGIKHKDCLLSATRSVGGHE